MSNALVPTGPLRALRNLVPFFRDRAPEGAKGAMVHPTGGAAWGRNTWLFNWLGASSMPATKVNWEQEVGDGLGSSVLAGPLNFLKRTFPEAPPVIERATGETWKPDPSHDLYKLLKRPNRYYNGREMFKATIVDYAFGNAYWYKVRAGKRVVQLWWLPRHLIWPHAPFDGSDFIDYYEYRPGTETLKLAVEDVVHFRNGIDPRNLRLGLSELGALLREIGVDDQAANFTSAILRNLGIIGLVVSPKEKGQKASPDAVKETKEYLKAMFTGDKRGEALVHGAPIDVQLLQYQMQNFDVSPIRDVSEERVCAALGLPAAVVGFGTGLQQTKVGATMKEMRQLAWTGGIIPHQDSIAEEIDRSLLPDFEGGKETPDVRMRFDTSKVRALWEDNNEKHTRVREDFKATIIDRATALRETGRPAAETDVGVYFVGRGTLTQTDPSAPIPKPVDPNAPDEETEA